MTDSTYNTITAALAIGVWIAFAALIVSLIATIVRWKSPRRRGHLVRLLISFAAIPILVGIQQAILWWVFLPELGRRQMTEISAARAKRFDETTLVKVGDTIPAFSVKTVDGETVTLPSPGKVVLINFFATWCGPCQLELPHIEQIWLNLKHDDHFRLVVVGREETPETVRNYCQQHRFSFPVGADPEREIYSLFAKESIPRTIVVSPEGRVVYSTLGFDEADIVALKALLNEQLAVLK